MTSIPSRRPTGPSPPEDHHHLHPPSNKFTASLNRLASSTNNPSHPTSPSHLIGRLCFRFSRRTRLILFISLVFILSFYWPQLKRKSIDWSNYHRSSSSAAHPDDSNLDSSSIGDPTLTRPTVSRTILDELERIEEFEKLEDDDLPLDQLRDEYRKTSSDQSNVPLVTTLPADRKHLSSIPNQDRCPDGLPSPCGFLLAGYVGEQETKAQVHVHQLGLLALALNRTLVLPQVNESRMGSCLRYPFDLYYDSNALTRLGIRTITHHKFVDWVTESSNLPSARLLAIVDRKQAPLTSPEGSISYDHSTPSKHLLHFKPDREFCVRNDHPNRFDDSRQPVDPNLKKVKLQLNHTFSPLTIVAFDRWHKSTRGRDQLAQQIIDAARKSDAFTDPFDPRASKADDQEHTSRPDVLVLNYELRHPFLDPTSEIGRALIRPGDLQPDTVTTTSLVAFKHFPYATVWLKFAQRLIEAAPTMVGVHWRQETLRANDLKLCSQRLVTTLESLKETYPSLQAIYLSTDYPVEQVHNKDLIDNLVGASNLDYRNDYSTSQKGPAAHSSTFKMITNEHHLMMIELMNRQLPLKWLTFNSLMDNLDLTSELINQIVQLPIFNRELKDLNRLLRIRLKKEDLIQRNSEIKRLIIERFRLKADSSVEVNDDDDDDREGLGRMDPGIIGILEKLILVRASLFITGIPNGCSKKSSFTQQVVEERQASMDQTFIDRGYLLDSDSWRNPSRSNSLKFNLVEFWG